MKNCIKHIAWLLMALSTLLFSCTQKELPIPGGEDEVTHVIPYRVTVEQLGQTRATLDIINQYIFELGDELYITYTDPEDPEKTIFGVLSLVAGEGATTATFEGELKSVGFMPSSDTPLKATLVSPHDRIHTERKNGKIGSNSAATLPKSDYAPTFADAVQQFSEFTGTSTFGSYTFSLEQKMSFLVFSVTFDPEKIPSEYRNDVSVTITSLNGDGDGDDVTLFSGGVPVTDNVTDLQSNFVIALPSTTLNANSTLSNASIVFTYNGGTAIEDGVWPGITRVLAKNNYYLFDKTQLDAKCFTIEAKEAGASIRFNYFYADNQIRYKRNGGEWVNVVDNSSISLSAREAIQVEGSANTITGNGALFTSDNPCYIYGDIMTLVWGAEYNPAEKSLSGSNANLFEGLFKDTDYIDIPSGRPLKLPDATTTECFKSMFKNCTSLTHAPALPAASVASGAYESMFEGCTSLTSAPELPATSVGSSGYKAMFMGCTALISAPMVLYASDVTANSCESMFEGCTSLLIAPRIDAGSVGDSGYKRMFYGCSSLLAAPDLDAITTIGNSAYLQMFMGCTSMASAPTSLPATVLKDYCYKEMFADCESLTNVPALPATNDVETVPVECYYGMFRNCQSINALPAGQPDLPLVKIGTNGCREMFMGCTGLVAAPQLANLTQVGEGGCYGMFYSCSEVTTIPSVLKPTSIPADAYRDMFNRCPRITETPDIKAVTMGSNACRSMFYGCTRLHTINGELLPTTLSDAVYCHMFYGCTSLTTAPELPATTLAPQCYMSMFSDCTALTTASALPATTLALQCYQNMFYGCTKLTTVPALAATTLAQQCCQAMFYGCTALTTAPALPATTLALQCYYQMFRGCTSLTTASALPATTLAQECYFEMFRGCSKLTTAPALPATTLAQQCYQSMFMSCSKLTTAPALPATTLVKQCYQAMFQYCKVLTGTVCLPAAVLVQDCYDNMFDGANAFDSLICLATSRTTWSGDGGTGGDDLVPSCNNWLQNVKATGTFYYAAGFGINLVEPTRGWVQPSVSGIPEGWTGQPYHMTPVFPPFNPFDPEEDL